MSEREKMPAKVILTIEGTAEDILDACRLIGLGEQLEGREEAWQPDEVKKLWDSLTSGARRVLKEIAKKPDGYPREDLLKALSLTGPQLAGTLSSLGHRMKNFPGKPWAAGLDWNEGTYRMPTGVAKVVSALEL